MVIDSRVLRLRLHIRRELGLGARIDALASDRIVIKDHRNAVHRTMYKTKVQMIGSDLEMAAAPGAPEFRLRKPGLYERIVFLFCLHRAASHECRDPKSSQTSAKLHHVQKFQR